MLGPGCLVLVCIEIIYILVMMSYLHFIVWCNVIDVDIIVSIILYRIVKDERFERLPCLHAGTYADDCLVQRVTQVMCLSLFYVIVYYCLG